MHDGGDRKAAIKRLEDLLATVLLPLSVKRADLRISSSRLWNTTSTKPKDEEEGGLIAASDADRSSGP